MAHWILQNLVWIFHTSQPYQWIYRAALHFEALMTDNMAEEDNFAAFKTALFHVDSQPNLS